MSKPASARPPIVAACIASSLLLALVAMTGPARAQDERIPNFAPDAHTGWLKPPGDEFIQPEHGPGPVRSDPAKPYIGRNIQAQETTKIADLSNPILQPWVVEQMRKSNEEVLAGKGGLHRALTLLAPWRARLPALSRASDLHHPVAEASGDDVGTGFPAPPRLARRAAQRQSEAVLVRRIGRPLRERRHPRRRHRRFQRPHLCGQLPHAAHDAASHGGALQALPAARSWKSPYRSRTPAPSRCRGPRSSATPATAANEVPLHEMVCAENNSDHFSQGLAPIPQADQPDF